MDVRFVRGRASVMPLWRQLKATCRALPWSLPRKLEALRCPEHPECRLTARPTDDGFELKGESCERFRHLVEERMTQMGAEPSK